jgi:hypothetical protein
MDEEINISKELALLLSSLNMINYKVQGLIESGMSYEEICFFLVSEVSLSNSFLIEKSMFEEYTNYITKMRNEHSDYQIKIASYNERTEL